MGGWSIVIPAWGERCVGRFLDAGLPALKEGLKRARDPKAATFLIYTDQPARIFADLRGYRSEMYGPPLLDNPHRNLGLVHARALRNAKPGTMVMLLCADHVPSVEAFAACETRFAQGKRLIICNGARTYCTTEFPPITTARNLLEWMWVHRHPHVAESIWGAGHTDQPSVLLFVNGSNVVAHGFHLHPLAVLADGRNLEFTGVTIDDNLAELFKREEIHIVQDADEMALAECSPLDPKRFQIRERVLTLQDVQGWAHQRFKNGRRLCSETHRWFFTHPICMRGEPGPALNPERVRELIDAAT